MAAVGDHLRAADDQVAGVIALEGTDLLPLPRRHVVGQRDEVEPRSRLRLRRSAQRAEGGVGAERVVEGLAHRRVPGVRVTGVHVEVARVPPGVGVGGRLLVGDRLVGLVGEGGIVDQVDLDPPLHHPVLGRKLVGDGGDPELRGPLPGRDRARQEADGRLLRRDRVRVGVDRALRRQGHVAAARPSPAAKLGLVGHAVAVLLGLVEAEVDRVPVEPLGVGEGGLVEAVLDPHGIGSGGDAEGDRDVGALDGSVECPGDHLVGARHRRARARRDELGRGPWRHRGGAVIVGDDRLGAMFGGRLDDVGRRRGGERHGHRGSDAECRGACGSENHAGFPFHGASLDRRQPVSCRSLGNELRFRWPSSVTTTRSSIRMPKRCGT